jgi:hypothetical protein
VNDKRRIVQRGSGPSGRGEQRGYQKRESVSASIEGLHLPLPLIDDLGMAVESSREKY